MQNHVTDVITGMHIVLLWKGLLIVSIPMKQLGSKC